MSPPSLPYFRDVILSSFQLNCLCGLPHESLKGWLHNFEFIYEKNSASCYAPPGSAIISAHTAAQAGGQTPPLNSEGLSAKHKLATTISAQNQKE